MLAGETVPQLAGQAAPFCARLQVTPLFAESFATVAVNCWVVFVATVAEVGETETESEEELLPPPPQPQVRPRTRRDPSRTLLIAPVAPGRISRFSTGTPLMEVGSPCKA